MLKDKPLLTHILALVLGSLLTIFVLYYTTIEPGSRTVTRGLEKIALLEDANRKLSSDLESSRTSAIELARRLEDRQRVINNINNAARGLSSGLSGGLATLNEVIDSIQRIIYILQNG